MTYLYSSGMDGCGTRCVLALESSVDDDDIWTAVLLERKGEGNAGGACTYDEDLGELR